MIFVDLQLQVIVCTVCKDEPVEIPRRLMRDQDGLLELKDATKHDHRECAANPRNVEKAIRDRTFRKAVEKELAKAAGKGARRRPRCNGRPQ